MKKDETYIPQFVFDATDNEYMSVCKKCGAEMLTLYDGYCFDCKKEVDGFPTSKIDRFHPADERLYNSRIEKKIEKRTFPFALGVLWIPFWKYGISLLLCTFAVTLFINFVNESLLLTIMSIVLFALGIFIVYLRKRFRHKKFCKYNEMIIEYTKSYGWLCPCCEEVNNDLRHCKVCGVRPGLIVNKDV